MATLSVSEYANKGYKESQNLTFDMLTWFLLPYIVAKASLSDGAAGRVHETNSRIAGCDSGHQSVRVPHGMTPFQLLFSRFFPYQGTGW